MPQSLSLHNSWKRGIKEIRYALKGDFHTRRPAHVFQDVGGKSPGDPMPTAVGLVT